MLDAYARRARLAPAVLAGLPALVLLAAGAVAPTRTASIVALVLGALGLVICGAVRDAGRAIQRDLWASWGGPPAVQRLRWHGPDDHDVVARRHAQLAQILGEPLPTEDEEASTPKAADRRYEYAVEALRELTRPTDQYPLVFAENVEYGFRRNCLGLRPVGMGIAVTGLVVSGLLLLSEGLAARFVVPLAAAAMGLVWWRRHVTPSWVRTAAERYAIQLMAATTPLARERSSQRYE